MESILSDTNIEKLRMFLQQAYTQLELRELTKNLKKLSQVYQNNALYWADYIRNIRIREKFYICL